MESIKALPYNQEVIDGGAFIKPDGSILYTNNHETFAKYYCYGYMNFPETIQQHLIDYKRGRCSKADIAFWLRRSGYNEDIDSLLESYSGNLTNEQFSLFCKYLNTGHGRTSSDFLIQYLGFDKISSPGIAATATVVTTCEKPYTRFFNYLIMNDRFYFKRAKRLVYSTEEDDFLEVDPTHNIDIKGIEAKTNTTFESRDLAILESLRDGSDNEETEAMEEIKLIRRLPDSERIKYLR